MMKSPISIFIVLLLSGCESFIGADPPNTRIEIFDEFWKGVSDNWPEFNSKKVNWDSLYNANRPLAQVANSDDDLTPALQNLLNGLKDEHTSIYLKSGKKIGYFPSYSRNFYGFTWVSKNYLSNYRGNNVIAYQLLNQNIGYIFIASFSNQTDKFAIIDQIIENFAGAKGIIIDVRDNQGGNDSNPQIIASRFADQAHTYGYRSYRVNQQRTSMGALIAQNIGTAGNLKFNGKVAILTNRYSFSATEDFVLMMKSFPNVIQLGDNTTGGSGTDPILRELPAGWSYRISSALLCDVNGHPITKGIAPDFYVQTTKADSIAGKDTIIERAIFELSK